jgi:hypothetical protein
MSDNQIWEGFLSCSAASIAPSRFEIFLTDPLPKGDRKPPNPRKRNLFPKETGVSVVDNRRGFRPEFLPHSVSSAIGARLSTFKTSANPNHMGGVFKWVQPKAVDIRRRRSVIIRQAGAQRSNLHNAANHCRSRFASSPPAPRNDRFVLSLSLRDRRLKRHCVANLVDLSRDMLVAAFRISRCNKYESQRI